jgi:hypothetical protein
MAGYVARKADLQYFRTAWRERVLDGPPKIPYLHMSEIRRESWRNKHNLSYNDSEECISEAVRVVTAAETWLLWVYT